MKKSSHTMERNIGIYVLGLLVFLAISCSQDVLAVNNVTLKVNAGNNTTTANKIYYKAGSLPAATVTMPWTEKAVYNGTYTADADVKITVTNEMAATTDADLIIKVDFLTATSGGAMNVTSGWLKYEDGAGEFGEPGVIIARDTQPVTYNAEETIVAKATLSTLPLKLHFKGKTSITLFNFSTKFNSATHIIFTAILVDNVSAVGGTGAHPQVMGVDIQSIYFNYIDVPTPITATSLTNPDWYDDTPIWLTFMKAAGTGL
jgi:hypothetical protein